MKDKWIKMSVAGNYLSIYENGKEFTVCLDEKNVWTVGRVSSDKEGIILETPTVSREHGVFMNMMGTWYYYNKKIKNTTLINGKVIKPGIGGRIRPVMLKDGDELILGGGTKPVVNDKTVCIKYFHKTDENV